MANHLNCDASGAAGSLSSFDSSDSPSGGSSSSSSCDDTNSSSCSGADSRDFISVQSIRGAGKRPITDYKYERGIATVLENEKLQSLSFGVADGDGGAGSGNCKASKSTSTPDTAETGCDSSNGELSAVCLETLAGLSIAEAAASNETVAVAEKSERMNAEDQNVNWNVVLAVQDDSSTEPNQSTPKAKEMNTENGRQYKKNEASSSDSDQTLKRFCEQSCQTMLGQKQFAQIISRVKSSQIRNVQQFHQQNHLNRPEIDEAKVTTVSTSIDTSSPGSSSDGTLRLVIKHFKSMCDTVRGDSKEIQSIPWRIMVMPRQHVVQKKGTQKCLGFFLQCCPNAYSDSWSCQAAAELRLISQRPNVPHFTRKTNHVYTAKENDWGYSCFMTWADIQDEEQGYIKDDTVILEVSVKAEPAKNVLTQEQFRKKIQDYKRLADLQSSRGYLDKAIECNASALKFCRDRDKFCREELEAQKQQLIDLKLKESIERIEKGPVAGKGDDESGGNHNAVKQAITGNTTKQLGVSKSYKSNGKAKDANYSDRSGVNQAPLRVRPPSPVTKPPDTEKGATEKSVTEDREKLDKTPASVQFMVNDTADKESETKIQMKSEKTPYSDQPSQQIRVKSIPPPSPPVSVEDEIRWKSEDRILEKGSNDGSSALLDAKALSELEEIFGKEQLQCLEDDDDENNEKLRRNVVNSTCQTDISICWDDHNWQLNEAALFAQASLPHITNHQRHYAKKGARKTTNPRKLEDVDWRRINKTVNITDNLMQTDALEMCVREQAGDPLDEEFDRDPMSMFNLRAHHGDHCIFKNMAPGVDHLFPESPIVFDDAMMRDDDVFKKGIIEDWIKTHIKSYRRYSGANENTDESNADLSQFSEAQVHQVTAALSVVRINCMNAKRLVDRAAEFITTLDKRSRNSVYRDCFTKIAEIVGDIKAAEYLRDFNPQCSNQAGHEQPRLDRLSDDSFLSADFLGNFDGAEHWKNFLANLDCVDDQNDYLLRKQIRRINKYAEQAFTSPIFQNQVTESFKAHVDIIEKTMESLKTERDSLKKALAAEKNRAHSALQRATDTSRTLEAHLRTEREKSQRSDQIITQKKNELKKNVKQIREKEIENERLRSSEKKLEHLRAEDQIVLNKLREENVALREMMRKDQVKVQEKDRKMAEFSERLSEELNNVKRELLAERNKNGALTERMRKSEISLINERWEIGKGRLMQFKQQAREQMAAYDLELKRVGSDIMNMDEIKRANAELERLIADVDEKLKTSELELSNQTEQIRKGTKTLNMLPKFEVPAPPQLPRVRLERSQPPSFSRAEKSFPSQTVGVIGQGPRAQPSPQSCSSNLNHASKNIEYTPEISGDMSSNTLLKYGNSNSGFNLFHNASGLSSSLLDQNVSRTQYSSFPAISWPSSTWSSDTRLAPIPHTTNATSRYGFGTNVSSPINLGMYDWDAPNHSDFEAYVDRIHDKVTMASDIGIQRIFVREYLVKMRNAKGVPETAMVQQIISSFKNFSMVPARSNQELFQSQPMRFSAHNPQSAFDIFPYTPGQYPQQPGNVQMMNRDPYLSHFSLQPQGDGQ